MKYSNTETLRRLVAKDPHSNVQVKLLDEGGFHVIEPIQVNVSAGYFKVLVLAKITGEANPARYVLDVRTADYMALPDWVPKRQRSRK